MTRSALRAPGFHTGGFSCRAGLLSALALFASLPGAASVNADSVSSTPVPEAAFLSENDIAMDRMMKAMTIRPSGDVDEDFVAMMVPHHQGAIDMAMAVLHYGHNEKIRRIAQEIIVTQQQEIVAMRLAVGERLPAPTIQPTTAVSPTAQGPAQRYLGMGTP